MKVNTCRVALSSADTYCTRLSPFPRLLAVRREVVKLLLSTKQLLTSDFVNHSWKDKAMLGFEVRSGGGAAVGADKSLAMVVHNYERYGR